MAKFRMKELLSEKSKFKETDLKDKVFEIKQIPIESIVPSSNNKYGIRDIEELAASIEMVGLLHNLVVREMEDSSTYELISGERRFRAIRKLYEEGMEEWETVPCKIEKNKDDVFTELELLLANSTARELTDAEKTYQAMRIKEVIIQLKKDGYKFEGRVRDIVANILNVSSSQVSRMESIDKRLSPELKEAFKEEEINISTAYELSKLPEEEQRKAHEELEIKGQISVSDIKDKKSLERVSEYQDPFIQENIEVEEDVQKEPRLIETIEALKTIAEELESGICSTSYNISNICKDAVALLQKVKSGESLW